MDEISLVLVSILCFLLVLFIIYFILDILIVRDLKKQIINLRAIYFEEIKKGRDEND